MRLRSMHTHDASLHRTHARRRFARWRRASAQDGGFGRVRLRRNVSSRQIGRDDITMHRFRQRNSSHSSRRDGHYSAAADGARGGQHSGFAAVAIVAFAGRMHVARHRHDHLRVHARGMHGISRRPEYQGQAQQRSRHATERAEQHDLKIAVGAMKCQSRAEPTAPCRSIFRFL